MSNNLSFMHPSSWLVLGCITLLQAINGTRYSIFNPTCKKEDCDFSHVQLNYLLVALEIGKLFGFLSGAAADHLPASMILLVGLIFGLVGYGGQYLLIANRIPLLSYWQVLLLSGIAGNSTCWISTYCYVLAIKNFRDWHGTIIAITSSYSVLCTRIYNILVEGVQGKRGSRNSSTYLLFTCFLPTTVGFAIAVIANLLKLMEYGGCDMSPLAFCVAISTGAYVVIESVVPSFALISPRLRALILGFVLVMPFIIALIIALLQFVVQKFKPEVPKIVLERLKNIAIDKEKYEVETDKEEESLMEGKKYGLTEEMMNVDFWLFYLVNVCGATLALIYMINLERISESVSNNGTSFLLEISSTFSFFGRIFSVMLNWYTRRKLIISNPALTVLLMLPMPVAFFLLINDSSKSCLYISTGILGSCSGALNAMSATTMYQLFGSKNFVAKQTIALTNVPLGFLLFGWIAAINYQKEGGGIHGICIGQHCYNGTFIIWGSFSFIGTILSFVLHLRTQNLYLHKS